MKKAFSKRQENIELKKLEKKIEASKLLLEQKITPPPIKETRQRPLSDAVGVQKKQKKQPSPPHSEEDEEESDSSVEKVIINVKNKKKKKKAKEIIIYNDNSESEESEEEIVLPKRALKTQQNKKTKIYQQHQPQRSCPSKMNNTDLLFC